MATLDVEPQPLGQAVVGLTPVLIYTVPAVSPDSGATVRSATIRDIKGANLTGAAARISVWIGPPIGSPDDTRLIFPDMIVPADGVAWDDGVNVVNAGGQIWGSGDSGSAFNITVSGALTVVA